MLLNKIVFHKGGGAHLLPDTLIASRLDRKQGRSGPPGHGENSRCAPQNMLEDGPFASQNFTTTYTFL